jgi:acetolactate synthase small subunit
MEHPLIENLDSLNVEQLQEKISELNKKLGIAAHTGNSYLCNQLRMALESYQNKYNEKIRGTGNAFNEVIDIS